MLADRAEPDENMMRGILCY